MNDQSLQESNAILAVAAARTEVGAEIHHSPGELAEQAGVGNRLAVARAVRALLARGRLEQDGDAYRLKDARPLAPGEPATVRRPVRRRGSRRTKSKADEPLTYDRVGRSVIDRLIELSAEVAEMRTALERSKAEAESARREAVEVSRGAGSDRRRAEGLEDEVHTLKRRLEMTESNLRSLVEVAKNRPSSPLEDTDARAILDILSTKD